MDVLLFVHQVGLDDPDVVEFGDYFRTQRWNQGPGADQPGLGKDLIKAKVAASIAHLYERPRVWLEGFYGSGWGTTSAGFVDATLCNYVMGYDLLGIHGMYYSTHGGWWEWRMLRDRGDGDLARVGDAHRATHEVMSSLIPVDGGGPIARCSVCGATAVGPCARCRAPVCGDCCELTDGGATTFAICTRCVRRGGATLAPSWLGLLGWLALIIVGLAAIGGVLVLLR